MEFTYYPPEMGGTSFGTAELAIPSLGYSNLSGLAREQQVVTALAINKRLKLPLQVSIHNENHPIRKHRLVSI
jgi:hypothetical protein